MAYNCYPAPFRVGLDYILSLRQPTFSRWTAHHEGAWLRITHFLSSSISMLPYHESLPVPQMCYHICLVEIALGLPRQFDGLVQKVHSYKLAYNRILSPISTIVIAVFLVWDKQATLILLCWLKKLIFLLIILYI